MSIAITINLTDTAANLITQYGAGAKLYLSSASSESGSYSAVTSTTLVSGTEQYTLYDTSGTTSTWYKSRVGDSIGSTFSDWSDPFQATSVQAYATLADLLETMDIPTGTGSSSRRNLLADLLVDATAAIDTQCGRSFFRNPQVSGTDTFTFNVVNPYARTLSEAIGHGLDVISVSTLEYRESSTSDYAAIAAGTAGYLLEPVPDALGSFWPYPDIRLSADSATTTTYPTGDSAVRLVGALGFERVPSLVKRACIDLAREWYRQGVGGGPSQIGTNQFGSPVYLTGYPATFKQLIAPGSPYVRRTFAVWV